MARWRGTRLLSGGGQGWKPEEGDIVMANATTTYEGAQSSGCAPLPSRPPSAEAEAS